MAGMLAGGFVLQTYRWARLVAKGEHGYLVGDWLISFAAGPVRRGLFGELLRHLTPDAAQSLAALFWALTAAYGILFLFAIAATLSVREPRRWAPLLLSPAFLLFVTNDFSGGYRKEVLGLTCLALVLVAIELPRLVRPLVAVALVLYIVAAYSHEVNALMGPAVALGILRLRDASLVGRMHARRVVVGLGLISVSALAFAARFGGSPGIAGGVCEDLVLRGFPEVVCDGSMIWLGQGVGDGFAFVAIWFPTLLGYIAAGAFAILPFAGLAWHCRVRMQVILVSAAVIPLFVVAVDYGRWIALGVTIASLFALSDGMRQNLSPRGMPLVALGLFLTGWRLPHVGGGSAVLQPSALVVLGEAVLARVASVAAG